LDFGNKMHSNDLASGNRYEFNKGEMGCAKILMTG
jgi:hypothetical protein